MARTARAKSESGIYHVMLRGINRQPVFLDENDETRFVEVLSQCRTVSGFQLLAYCLMGNHVHLLLKIGTEPLEQVMKRIGTRYVVWYNTKHGRTGHLFQDRYRSEPVDSDAYLLTVLRYILNNPVKAGICQKSTDYRMSSAREYFGGDGITDISFAEEIAGQNALRAFLEAPSDDVCMDDEPGKVNDAEAARIICRLFGAARPEICAGMKPERLELCIPQFREAGVSLRQISRLTGIPMGIVRKY